MEPSDSDRLSQLVAECIDRWEDEGSSALETLCREHPEHASTLRARLSRLHEAGLLGEAPTDAPLPERLGGFRILSLIGRGGMGVVYLAEQEGLGRRVALKLVRPEGLFFPGARERFRREVEAVARMAHPGIVPVYAAGEAQGIPFAAMEYVRGATLHEIVEEAARRARPSGEELLDIVKSLVLGREPGWSDSGVRTEAAVRLFSGTWAAACLRIARQVAEALQHAHEQGVLHRDVKPGNVMVTPDGRVLLLDFGLAAAEGSAKLTSSGTQLGSLAWMAPEQVAGRHEAVDARSDVYSLGATLYELLTLRSPFGGEDVAATRDRILSGALTPPRELLPDVPRDAETVCLTALDRDPARRYATAAAFAEDLGCVLDLRPIAARRPDALLRARRWAQRRPAAAVAVVLGALLLVAGPLGWELNRVRTLHEMEEAAARSERNFQAALAAIGHVLRDMAAYELADVPHMQRARLAALDRALELFPALERDRPGDLQVLTERADLHSSRGEVLRDLGRPDEALAEFHLALTQCRTLLELDPRPARRADVALVLGQAGKALRSTLRAEEALPYFEEAVSELRRACAEQPDDHWKLNLALTLANHNESVFAVGDLETSERLLDEARSLAAAVREQRPHDPHTLWAEGRILDDTADLHAERGDDEAALAFAERALEAYRAAHAESPESRYYLFDVTTGLHSCASHATDVGDFERARAALDEAAPLVEELLRDFPDSERYLRRRGELLDLGADVAHKSGDGARAAEMLAALLPIKEARAALEPDRCDLQLDAAMTQVNLASALILQVRDLEVAHAHAAEVERRLQACEAAGALSTSGHDVLSMARYQQVLAACLLDRTEEARPGVEEYDARARSGDARDQRLAADLWNEWLLLLRRTAPDPAAEARARTRCYARLRAAIEAGYANLEELRTTASLDALRDEPEFQALLELAARRVPQP